MIQMIKFGLKENFGGNIHALHVWNNACSYTTCDVEQTPYGLSRLPSAPKIAQSKKMH